jgi:hypothetical protein
VTDRGKSYCHGSKIIVEGDSLEVVEAHRNKDCCWKSYGMGFFF